MSKILYLKTELFTKGCPEDESESTTKKRTFILVPVEDEDAFNESCADDYGNQDYSYYVNYSKVITLSDEDLIELSAELELVKRGF
jgi:hypothetical protein